MKYRDVNMVSGKLIKAETLPSNGGRGSQMKN